MTATYPAIKQNMNKKPTDDLLSIWTVNNRDKWSNEAFDAIREILNERQVTIPEQINYSKPSVNSSSKQPKFVINDGVITYQADENEIKAKPNWAARVLLWFFWTIVWFFMLGVIGLLFKFIQICYVKIILSFSPSDAAMKNASMFYGVIYAAGMFGMLFLLINGFRFITRITKQKK